MNRLLTPKVIVVFVACYSATLFATTNNNDSDNPLTTASPKQPVENIPMVTTSSRGQLLYENHCTVCHDSGVHIRAQRKARSTTDIHKWVIRWSKHLKLDWSSAEVNEVSEFLNQHFYHFPGVETDAK